MSNNNIQNRGKGSGKPEGGFEDQGGSRARTPEAGEGERVSISNPPGQGGPVRAPLKTPGQIKLAYEQGRLDLDDFVQNVKAGLLAEKAVVTTHTKGAGKDRETWQEVQWAPDWDMRLRWQQHVTETVEGMPVKRQEIVSRKLTTTEDLVAQAKKSPAFARSLLRQLERIVSDSAERSKKGGGENRRPEPEK